MSRLFAWIWLLVAALAGCGFGGADDTGRPIPADYWRWRCPDGGAPAPDAGCVAGGADAATSDAAGDAGGDAR